ncbi:hypothetical protein EV193_109188 [Herbihabitans rhizosphaerae]|uniref:Uncharacterized protein n=1 Tax=Herbihabitans rhizosphaerae TaxID=1872711 RepID=A0A4V2ERX6_9PSEU|nr:DUF6313 family protein [Herbihabitans rhizosphaerae]RZS34397.1 hypothetical protein EV193_109188 [Herbihabitans rhizosphaerae]
MSVVRDVVRWFRRWRRGRARHSGIPYWLMVQGYLVLVPFALLFVITAAVCGARNAYDVMLQIASPGEVGYQWLTVPLSMGGWLIVPGFAGALAGIVVVEVTSNRRGRQADRPGGRARSGEIPRLNWLQYYRHDHDIPDYFALRFAQRHGSDWKLAQDHWEILIERFLTIEAFDRRLGARVVMAQAVSAVAYFLHGLSGKCPECAKVARPNE